MKEVTARFLTQIIEENGDCAEFRDDYSGYGKVTCAVDVDSDSVVIKALANFTLNVGGLDEDQVEALEELSRGISSDSMGLGIVVY